MVPAPRSHLAIITGERSGDAYGAAVLRRLRDRCGEIECVAMGGDELQAAGAEIVQRSDGLGVMGLLPVLRRLPEFLAIHRRVAAAVRARRPAVVLTIDYPGFNLRLLRRLADLRAGGTRLVHLVAPQVWAWRPRRAKAVARTVDRLLCFFPFEPPLFTRFGCQADFVGHPLVDLVRPAPAAMPAVGPRLLLLAPGSRQREVSALLPVMDQAVRLALPRLRAQGDIEVVVSTVADLPRALYRQHTDFPLVDEDFRGLCRRAHAAVIASGTATLEAALLALPQVIVYRGDPVTAAVMRHLIRTPHIGLPNIVHADRVVGELLQDELQPARLAARVIGLWDGPDRERCRARLATTALRLGGGGAMDRIADILAAELRPALVAEGASRAE